ncbi:hypothetical protein J6TS7_23970 [Paenibacillus dendritiformis]|nr:hypothetical protein J6TS7_23970 [Paenibacillus dendritiformis]
MGEAFEQGSEVWEFHPDITPNEKLSAQQIINPHNETLRWFAETKQAQELRSSSFKKSYPG